MFGINFMRYPVIKTLYIEYWPTYQILECSYSLILASAQNIPYRSGPKNDFDRGLAIFVILFK